MPFTPSQQKALAIAPMVAAPLSMFGSGCIIKVIRTEKAKLSNTYHRILLTMSIIDFTSSFSHGLSTLPIPRGTPGVWGASGNTATCIAQGFFNHPITWMPALNASLAVYYLLVGRYKWTEDRIRKLQPFMIGAPVLLGYGTAIASVALKLFNSANLWCWIAPFPPGCKDSHRYGDDANCVRGDNAVIYRYAFTFIPLWTSIFLATCCMVLVYVTVLKQEKEVDKFQVDGVAVRTQSRRIFWQGLWYVVAFYMTWLPSTIVRLIQALPNGKIPFPLIFVMVIMVPLQGFWNFLVFSRARYHKYRRENPVATKLLAVKVAAFSASPVTGPAKMVELESCATPDFSAFPVRTESMLQSEVLPRDTCQHR